MKKSLLFLAIAIASTTTLTAQINKGEKLLGASLSFHNGKTETGDFNTVKSTQFEVLPSLGFGVGNNWIVGFHLGYNHTNEKGETTGTETETKLNVFALGAWARKFHPLTNQFGIYGQGNLLAGLGTAKATNDDFMDPVKANVNSYSANVQPGFYFLPGKKIVIEATFGTIGYTFTKRNYKGNAPDYKASDFNFSVTDGLSLGVKFIL